jgi:hypothetical protein
MTPLGKSQTFEGLLACTNEVWQKVFLSSVIPTKTWAFSVMLTRVLNLSFCWRLNHGLTR